MRIAFDAKRAFLNSSGLGNYARTLINSLAENFLDHQYLLFTPSVLKNDFENFYLGRKNVEVIQPDDFLGQTIPGYWRSFGSTKDLNEHAPDIYHGLSNELPVNINKAKFKKVVTIHDLIFLRYPDYYSSIDRKIYHRKTMSACKNADAIVSISEQTKMDLIEFLKVDPEKIEVVYQSCSPRFFESFSLEKINAFKKEKNLPEKYLLYVGTIEERKNLLTIVKSLAQMPDEKLVVIGKKKNYFQEVKHVIDELKLNDRIIFPENVSNDELPLYYQGASIFIYPSVFEGFGIPVTEALWSKTPVITSKGSCFSEAGGPHTFYIDPLNAEELTNAVLKISSDTTLQNEMKLRGFEYVQQFHPQKVSYNLMKLYDKLLR